MPAPPASLACQDDNPMLSMHPTDFTNDPQVIARNDRMAAVNAALAVDLTGQVRAALCCGDPVLGFAGCRVLLLLHDGYSIACRCSRLL